MSELDWESYFNDVSRVQGLQSKSKSHIFKLLPNQGGIDLRIQDKYSGELIKILPFEDQKYAMAVAEQINQAIIAGRNLNEIFKK
jgi:hypothetical protein